MAPRKVHDAPPVEPLPAEGSDGVEVMDLDPEEPPPKKQKQNQQEQNQYTRSQQILEGSNKNTREDTEGSQIGYYGNDGPAPHVNTGPALPGSEAFLAQQLEMKYYMEELEARFDEDKEKAIKEKIIKQARRDAQRGTRLDAMEEGRKEFERKKARLRVEIERELRPKIEKEIRKRMEKGE